MSSRVVEQIKAKYPSYRDVPDDELTVAIGKKYPVYLEQDPAFASDYKRLTSRGGATNEEPQAVMAGGASNTASGGATLLGGENPAPLYRRPESFSPGTFPEDVQGGESPEVMAEVEAEIQRTEEIGSIKAHEPGFLERVRRSESVRRVLGPTVEEREGALDSAKPHPSPVDIARAMVHATTPPAPLTEAALEMTAQGVAGLPAPVQGAVKGIVEVAMGTPVALPVGGRLVSGAFAVDLASQLPELKKQFDVAVKEGNTEEAWQLGTAIVATSAFSGLAAKHAIAKRKLETPKESVEIAATQAEIAKAPATAEALRQQTVEAVEAPKAEVKPPKKQPAQPELPQWERVKAPPRTEVAGEYEQFGPEGKLKVVAKSRDGKKLLVRYEKSDPLAAPVEVPLDKVISMKRRVKPAQEPTPEDLAEREAIDAAAGENEAVGLPSKVVIEGTTKETKTDDPFARDRIAYVDSMGNIRINQPVFREWLKEGVRPGQEKAAISALLRHEGIHAVGRTVIPDADFASVFSSLTAAEKALLRKAYTGEGKGVGHTDVQMGHEYVRRAMERLMGGPVSERVGAKGLERITQPVLDIIERIVVAARKLVGTKASKELQSILDRIQENTGRVKAGESVETPAAYYRRKSKPGEGQEEMKMEGVGERISAEEARSKTFASIPVNMREVSTKADTLLASGHLDFKKFENEMGGSYGITKGQLREAWEDAVWRRAIAKLPKKEDPVKRSVLPGFEKPSEKEPLDYRPGEFRPENRIASEALRLINQAHKGDPPPLRREKVTVDDVRIGAKDSFIEFEPGTKVTGAELVKEASTDRTTAIRELVSEGVARTIARRRGGEAETKRVTALLNEKTGEVQLVSTYSEKGLVRVYDPRFSHKQERPSVPYDKLQKEAPEWKPIASALLDEPVRHFRQRFATREAFEAEFAERVREDYERAQEISEAPKGENEDAGVPALRPGGPLNENETKSLYKALFEEKEVESVADIDSFLSRMEDRAKAGKLTAKDWTAINALDKIHTAVEGDNPSVLPNEIITRTKDRIYSLARLAESGDEFVSLAMEQFAGERKTSAPVRETQREEPKAKFKEVAERRRAAQSMAEAAAESAALQDALSKTEKLSPSFYEDVLNPDVNAPEAFLRRSGTMDRGQRAVAKWLRSKLNAAVFNPLRLESEWMVDKMRRVAAALPDYERGVVEDATGKLNKIISDTHGYQADMMVRFGDDLIQMAGRVDAPIWLNQVEVIEKNGTAIRNAKEAIEGRLRAPDAKTQKYIDAGQEGNVLIGEMLEPVSPGFIRNGGMSSNWTPLRYDAVMSHSTERDSIREKIIRGDATANGVTPSTIRQRFNRMRDLLSEPGSSEAKVAAVAQDFTREYPSITTDVWIGKGKLGHWEPTVHATFHDYFHHGIRKAAMIRAFREMYPRDTTAMDLDYTMLRRLLPVKYHGLVDSTFRLLQGQPSESSLGQQSLAAIETAARDIGSHLGPVRSIYDAASPVFRALMLTRQIALQPAELISGANAVFFGYKRTFADAVTRYTKDYAALEQAGMIDRMMYNDSFDPRAPSRSVGRIASNLIRRVFLENVPNEMQEAQNAMGALVTARQIFDAATGGPPIKASRAATLRKTFEYMGFTREEVNRMFEGDTELLTQMQRKAASWLSAGHKHPAERSRLLSNRSFQKAFWFRDYPAARTNQLIKIVDTILGDLEAGRYGEAATGAKILSKFGFGTAAQGTIQLGLLALFGGGLYGLAIKRKEAQDEPIQFTAEAMRAAVGGPVQQLIDGYEDRGLIGAKDNVVKLMTPTPYSIISDLSAAVAGRGKYRDIPLHERLGRFVAGKTPGYEALKSGIALDLLGSDKQLDDAKMKASLKAFYRWRRENFGGTESDSYLKEDLKKNFRMGMRKAKDALMKGDNEGLRNALEKAAVGAAEVIATEEEEKKGSPEKRIKERIARSMESQYILKVETAAGSYRELKPSEIEKLKGSIGDDPVQRIQMFDALLKAVADEIRK